MNPLELYLNRIARELRSMPSVKRDEELRELRSHLEQCVEDFAAQGLKIEDAQARAVGGFGSPRALGGKLCDAWEGIAFSWWRVVAAVLGVTPLLWLGVVNIAIAFVGLSQQPEKVLFPEATPIFVLLFGSVLFACGMLFSRWLGRRGRFIALVYALVFLDPWPTWTLITHRSPSQYEFLALVVWPALATAAMLTGAVVFHALRSRTHRLVVAGGPTLAPRQTPFLGVPPLKTWARSFGVCAVLALLEYGRVQLTLHPTTPEGALRYSLLMNSDAPGLERPRILQMDELALHTPAEIAGRERWLRFKVESRATPGLRTNMMNIYKAVSNYEEAHGGSKGDPRVRAALARLQLNRQIIITTARLIRTPNGWQVDEKSFDRSKLWSWFSNG